MSAASAKNLIQESYLFVFIGEGGGVGLMVVTVMLLLLLALLILYIVDARVSFARYTKMGEPVLFMATALDLRANT